MLRKASYMLMCTRLFYSYFLSSFLSFFLTFSFASLLRFNIQFDLFIYYSWALLAPLTLRCNVIDAYCSPVFSICLLKLLLGCLGASYGVLNG